MTTGLRVFDTTLQKTHIWLNEIQEQIGAEDERAAYQALRATLHCLRDRLTVEEATDLGAQLPMLVRGLYYEGWNPSGKPVRDRDQQEFLNKVGQYFANNPERIPEIDPERAVRAVFRVLNRRITEGEIKDIVRSLPRYMRVWWPQAARF